jgi:hypothetical protein
MKSIKILFCVVVAGLAAISTGNAQVIIHNWYPPATLNISGVFVWNTDSGGDYGTYTKWENARARFASKDLIKVLNSSATFTNVLHDVNGVTQIPDGSSLMFDINNDWSIFVTNRNGFNFLLTDVYDPVQNQYYTFLDVFHDNSTGSSKFNNASGAGHETDRVDFHLTFNDGEGTLFDFTGVGEFTWTTAPKESSISQKVSVSGKVTGGGNASYQGQYAVMQATVSAKGKGMVESFLPFHMWYPLQGRNPFPDVPPLQH